MVVVQAAVGLRLGELLALRAQDVSFLARTVRVEHQLERRTRKRVEPKTPRSRRVIPLPQVAAEALAEHVRRGLPLPSGELFYGHNGQPYDHAMYGTRIFAAAVARLAAAEESTFPAATSTHDCRHHYASILLAGGESVVAVAERLGHDNAGMVLRVYGHLLQDNEDRTRRVVDDAWSAGSPGELPRPKDGPDDLRDRVTAGQPHQQAQHQPSNLYPSPRTVTRCRGADGSDSTFDRSRLTWTSSVLVSPT